MKISNNGQQHWSISQSKEFGNDVFQSLKSISDAKRRQKAKQAWVASIATIKADPMTAGGPRFRYHHLDLLNFIYTNDTSRCTTLWMKPATSFIFANSF